MLAKLIKHEFKATWRTFVPLYTGLLAVMAIASVFATVRPVGLPVAEVTVLAMTVVSALVVAMLVITLITTIQRFAANLFKEEGYLMFTLPVSTDSLILSKLLVSIVWFIASFMMVALVVVLLAVLSSSPDPATLVNGLSVQADGDSPVLAVAAVQLAVSSVLYVASVVLMLYASIAAGQLVNRNRVAASVVAFALMYAALQLLSWFTGAGLTVFYIGSPAAVTTSKPLPAVQQMLLPALVSAAFYLLTRYCLKRRLNLE